MQLKFNKTIRKNIVTVDLEAIKFTPREMEAFFRFGEPVISVEKMYPLNDENASFPVKFSKRLRPSFRVRVKFDGTHDVEAACLAAESFYEDIVEIIQNVLYDITDKLDDSLTYDLGRGVEIIRSGEETLPQPPTNPPMGCVRPPYKPDYKPDFNPGDHVCPPKPSIRPPKPGSCNCSDDSMVIWTDGDSIHI